MARHRYALIWIFGVALAPAAWGQTSLVPQAGVLVLRNGQVIAGEITRAGDLYVVTLGENAEIRQSAAEVEAVCASLEEAYEFKLRHLSAGGSVKPHLDLAEWCLRHNLHARCAEQLVAAMRIAPEDERLLQLERRLKLSVESPVAATPLNPTSTAVVSSQQLDEALRSLPRGSIEKFSATVQPILLNRCAANQCHGPNAKSEYSLLRPPEGQIASRRFTQRNLYATLRYINTSDPDASPLVVMAQQRHGKALTAVFDKHSQNQLAELIGWAKLSAGTAPPLAPRTIGAAPTTLLQPATALPASSGQREAPDAVRLNGPTPVGTEVKTMRPRLDSGIEAHSPAAAERFVPKDRYDPELFNRKYVGGKDK